MPRVWPQKKTKDKKKKKKDEERKAQELESNIRGGGVESINSEDANQES